jgi:hypothetical protein
MLKPTCSCDKRAAGGPAPAGAAPGPRGAEDGAAAEPATAAADEAFTPGTGGALAPSR